MNKWCLMGAMPHRGGGRRGGWVGVVIAFKESTSFPCLLQFTLFTLEFVDSFSLPQC